MTPDLDLLSFGEALVDLFPLRPGQSLAECAHFVRELGGAPANVAVGLARRGARVGMATLVGSDAFGDFVLRALADEGIDVSAVGRHPTAKTGVAFVAVALDGARSFLFFRHPSADMAFATSDVSRATIARARILHLGSSTLAREPSRAATLQAVAWASELRVPLSVDPNLRAHLWDDPAIARGLLAPILAQAAMVKISDDELESLLGVAPHAVEEGAAKLRTMGCGLAIITLGARGAYFDGPMGRGYVPAVPAEVVDTTGAGDAFVAGFWSALVPALRDGKLPAQLERARIVEAIEAGCCMGAEAVTAMGATTGILRHDAVAMAPTQLSAWASTATRELLATRIFRVQGRTLTSPRTGLSREYSIIEAPDWCNIVALTDDGHVVMVRQLRHGTGDITLELPGGMIDATDADPSAAAIRELREETGYAGTNGRLIGSTAPNPAMQTNRCWTALVEHATRVGDLVQDDGEDIEVVLVPYRDIPAMIARGEITHS
ncbi:MAG: PfkB family carbohydrate kinase, partial [Polyangia bacterium]